MSLRAPKAMISYAIWAVLTSGCGSNVFASSDPGDPAEDALIAMENDNPDRAISILEYALATDAGSALYLSLLSAAYAQRAGIEPIQFARDMATIGGSTSTSSGLLAAFSILPPATINALNDIDHAVTILTDLGAERFLSGDPLKLGVYQSAAFLLHSKALDRNLDGVISPEEAANLNDTSASGLLQQMKAAQATLASQANSNPSAGKAATALENFESNIDAQTGATQEERLRNYLASRETTGQ